MILLEKFVYTMCCVTVLFAVADTEYLNPGLTGNLDSKVEDIRIENKEALPSLLYNKRHCYAGDKKDTSKIVNTWTKPFHKIKLQDTQNTADMKQAANLKANKDNQIRIIQHLARNPYSMMNQNSKAANLKLDDLSTWEHAKPRTKRMNNDENKEREDEQLKANIEEVFKSRSLDSNKLTDNNILHENTVTYNDPELNENIQDVFGFAPSARLLAQNIPNSDTQNNPNELTNNEETDDVDATTKKTNLNAMILEQFGPEIVDDGDEQETTTEYRFTDKKTLLKKYNNMAQNHHHSTNTSKSENSSGADSNQPRSNASSLSASILFTTTLMAVIVHTRLD